MSYESTVPVMRRNTYLVGEDIDFTWDLSEVAEAEHMWREGLSMEDMATAFDRPAIEVFVMLHERLEGSHIKARHGGMFGNRRR